MRFGCSFGWWCAVIHRTWFIYSILVNLGWVSFGVFRTFYLDLEEIEELLLWFHEIKFKFHLDLLKTDKSFRWLRFLKWILAQLSTDEDVVE